MPLVIPETETADDSPELREFKRKVVTVTNRYVSNHGHEAAARDALRQLGLIDPDRLAVEADVVIREKFMLSVPLSLIKDKTEEEANAAIADHIRQNTYTGNTSYFEFRNGIERKHNTRHTVWEVADANLVSS